MLHNVRALERMSVVAIDGELGSVVDVCVDDDSWTVRYLVVEAGSTWLQGRKFLISPLSLRAVFWKLGQLDTTLTRDQVRDSPGIDVDMSISRAYETAFFDYYGYPYYWLGPCRWGAMPFPPVFTFQPSGLDAQAAAADVAEQHQGIHLHRMHAAAGCRIHAIDGAIGHVQDFLYSDEDWSMPFLLVDTRNWLPGRHVVLDIKWIEAISWSQRTLHVGLTRDAVRNCPEWRAEFQSLPDYEGFLAQHATRSDGSAAHRRPTRSAHVEGNK